MAASPWATCHLPQALCNSCKAGASGDLANEFPGRVVLQHHVGISGEQNHLYFIQKDINSLQVLSALVFSPSSVKNHMSSLRKY